MKEYAILGALQGIVEWLPISSEGTLVLAQTLLFGSDATLGEMIQVALFLHLGSTLAVGIYFWRDLWKLFYTFIRYPKASREDRALLNFLLITSIITGTLGYGIFRLIEHVEASVFALSGAFITIGIGVLLVVTSVLQFTAQEKRDGRLRESKDLTVIDACILGVVQACAALPGLSRSGTTIPALLLRKIRDIDALKVSFFMSLPVILGGNIILNFEMISPSGAEVVGLVFAFIFGIITIHVFMRLATRLSFAHFTLFFGVLTFIAGLVSLAL